VIWGGPRFSVEKLETDLKIERGGSRIRDGLKKLSIRGDYDGEYNIEIWSRKEGAEIKWAGHIDTEDVNVKKGQYWVWNYAKLNRADMVRIGRWLIAHAKEASRGEGGGDGM